MQTTKHEIYVYGEQARAVQDGDLYRATVIDVEGRKTVRLDRIEET